MDHANKLVTLGPVGDTDLRLLRIYKSVVDAGGFSAAQVDLNISRSAISMAISDLETRLALRLCQRGRAGFTVTEDGQQVYDAVIQLLAAVEGFRTNINTLHAQLQGELNIGITDNLVTLPHMRITDALRQLKQKGPNIRVNISMMPPSNIEKALLDGRLHAGAVPTLRYLADLEYLPLYQEQSQLYCSNQHPLFNMPSQQAAQLVTEYDAIAPSYPQSAIVRTHYQSLRTTATATDREGVAFLILTGCYIGYLPTHFADQWLHQGYMQAIAPKQFHYKTDYAAITRKIAPPNLLLKTWLEALEPAT
jgi:DNA-binding transcriptional LysR family regulator